MPAWLQHRFSPGGIANLLCTLQKQRSLRGKLKTCSGTRRRGTLSCAASFVLRSTLPRLAGYGSGICAAVSDANVPDEVAVSLAGFDAASWQSWRHSSSTPLTQLAWNRCRRKCSPRHPFGYSSADAERPATSTAFKSTCREYLYAGSASCFVGGFARFRFMAGSMACQA